MSSPSGGPATAVLPVASMELHPLSQPTTGLKHVPLGLHEDALGRGRGVPNDVVAIGIVHVFLAEPLHGLVLLRREGGVALRHEGGVAVGAVGGRDLFDGVHGAAFQYEVPELRHEGLVPRTGFTVEEEAYDLVVSGAFDIEVAEKRGIAFPVGDGGEVKRRRRVGGGDAKEEGPQGERILSPHVIWFLLLPGLA
nr:hypothetical protein DM860_013446 [Ipomoea batatas]